MSTGGEPRRPALAPAMGGANQKRSDSSVSVSRTWKVPPRPRPGRKPKPKLKPKKESASNEDSEPKRDVSDPPCGLCDNDNDNGCICSDINLSVQSHQQHSPLSSAGLSPIAVPKEKTSALSLHEILAQPYSAPAVPLKRPRRPSEDGERFKLPKLDPNPKMQAGIHSPYSTSDQNTELSLKAPSEFDSGMEEKKVPSIIPLGEKCGFCTEVTPCMCADVKATSEIQILSEQSCSDCSTDPHSMLFCLSLGAAKPLAAGAVSIPCNLAFKTLQKHHRFASSDLGMIVRHLESRDRQVGVQSINRVLQELQHGDIL